MTQLEHLFAEGIRFDTEVQYLARSTSGLRHESLPLRRSSQARACVLTSLLQAALIQGQLPRSRWLTRARRAISRALSAQGAIDVEAILRGIQALGVEVEGIATIRAEVVAAGADQIGRAALRALRSGQLCLLQYESPRSMNWALVIGVESQRGGDQARTLLLLDAGASEVWACAHNVRIELEGAAGRAVNAQPGFPLNCRHLTGEAESVRLASLVVLKRETLQAG